MNKYEIIQKLDMIDNLLNFHFRNYGPSIDPINSIWDDTGLSDSQNRHDLFLIRGWLKEIANEIEKEKIYE